jgi:hypothetical protein
MDNNVLLWIKSVLETTPARWINLSQTLPGELLKRSPAPREWSALECLQHLVDTERHVFPVRVKYLLAGQDFPAFDPDGQGTVLEEGKSAGDLAVEFANMRRGSMELLEQLNSNDLEKRARHQELGVVTLSELLHEWAGHDLMHTVQAERALMQPFIAACGPWQRYFADHAIDPILDS